ncbi:hypothetical protein AB0L41_46800 [Amycolatopsis mediterranei]|uniref:hypothetical protein n=1 Tax=Amycolatopsis mediterranei TaxID=33910 RepID=UPI00341C5370
MQDLTDVLSTLRHTGSPDPAGADTVAADVARGHAALIRRRRRRIVGSGVVAVAAAAAVAVGTVGLGHGGQTVEAGQGTAKQQTASVQLAAYTGAQPAGFTVATIPAGWHVASSTSYAFVVTPPGADYRNYTSGIAVMLQGQSRLPSDSPVTNVTINGKAGVQGLTRGKKAQWLIFSDAAGHQVLVQVPSHLGLSNDQIVRFAQGITVTGQAQTAGG